MELQDLLLSILVSGGVAAAILAFTRRSVNARMLAYYDEKVARFEGQMRKETQAGLAKIREQLREDADLRLAMTHAQMDRTSHRDEDLRRLRRATFPTVVEFTYRLRDSARAIASMGYSDDTSVDAFDAKFDAFKEMLQDTQFGVEQAGQFDPAHGFNNALVAFSLALSEGRRGADLNGLYAQIDLAHVALIRGLTERARACRS